MSVEVVELIEGPRLRGNAIEFVYHVYGTDDILEARDALLDDANTPPTFNDLDRDLLPDIDPEGEFWKAIVRYGTVGGGIGGPPTGFERHDFAIGGGSARIKTAISTQSFGANAPDTGALIGVSDDGAGGWTAQGLDINVPTSEFTIVRYMPASTITDAYQLQLEAMAFTTNDAVFRGRAIGEVLFLGANGTLRPTLSDYEMAFRFARRINRTDIVVPGVPSDITVTGTTGGWQYLEPIEKQGRLLGVKRHTLYLASNFSNLGIPVS